MKFLFLMTQDLESPLGVGRIGPFARGLSQLGHNITIIALHPNYKALQKTEFFSDGVRFNTLHLCTFLRRVIRNSITPRVIY